MTMIRTSRTIPLRSHMTYKLFQSIALPATITICWSVLLLTGCDDLISGQYDRSTQSQHSSTSGTTDGDIDPEVAVKISPDATAQPDADHTFCTSPWDWPFVPISFRIHPLTRFTDTASTNKRVIESRIEFYDSQGHNTKGLGTIRFELYARDDLGSGSTRVGRLAMWEPTISAIEANTLHYDDITRTYLFLLEIDPDISLPATGILMCTVIMNDDKRIQGQTEIRLR